MANLVEAESIDVELLSEVTAFLSRYEELCNRCDFDLLIPYISEDATFWFSNGSYSGIRQIRAAFEQTWKTIQNEQYVISNVRWIVLTPAYAVYSYSFTSDGTVRGGQQTYSGLGTNVIRKVDGRWNIIHEHLSKKSS